MCRVILLLEVSSSSLQVGANKDAKSCFSLRQILNDSFSFKESSPDPGGQEKHCLAGAQQGPLLTDGLTEALAQVSSITAAC